MVPDGSGVVDGQVLQQTLGDTAELNVEVVSLQFAADSLAVVWR